MQKVFAHRGASGYAPENTLEAFALAVKQGAHGVELDVHISRDGELVVAHDERIDRVANGSGFICEMTVAELKGYTFNRTRPDYAGATLPTLREVYELLAPTGLEVNVELKNSIIGYEGLEQRCLDLAAETGFSKRVIYSSFNHYSMARLKRLDPSARCGLLYHATMVNPWAYAKALGMDAIHPHMTELLVPGECEKAHAAGIAVHTWTADEEDHIRRAFAAGADIVISNYPDRALAVLGNP